MTGARGLRPDPGHALLDLYDAALPQVYGYLLARCGRPALAEDLTADTFLAAVAACRRAPPPEPPEPPDPPEPPEPSVGWLAGIARHKLVDHWRAAEREERGLRAVHGARPDAADPWEGHLDALLAREVLAEQTATHRAALTLRYLDGLPVADVADHLGRPTQATEALLVRARAAFRRSYRRREGGDD